MIKHKKQNTYKSFIQTRIAWSEVKKLFILPIILVLVACQTGPTVDGSDEKSFDTSMATIKGTLDKKDHEKLEKIMKGFEYLYSDNIISALNASAAIKNRIRTRLDGMNATEIFEEWNDRVDKAIRKLEEKKNNTETAMENLKDDYIRRAEFYRQRGQSVVKLTVENKTEHAIGKVYFRGTLRRRETRKWILEDDFNYNIRHTEGKDLQPDEKAVWNFALLSPAWKKVSQKAEELYLSVTVTRIDGAPETPIYDAFTDRFTRKDSRRLKELISLKKLINTFKNDETKNQN